MDADLENCPEDIPALLEPLGRGYDLVCGYRDGRHSPWLTRRLPSWLMNAYVRHRTGTRVRDLGCGMRAFHASVVRNLEAEGEARRLLTPLMLRRARQVAEVRLRPGAKYKSGGHSFMSLLGIAVDYYMLTARRPFLLSGLVCGAAAGLGIAISIFGPPLAGLVLFTGGSVGVLVSLVGEYCQRLYQLSQRLPFYLLRDLDDEQRVEQRRVTEAQARE
jgi:hypothetical protein